MHGRQPLAQRFGRQHLEIDVQCQQPVKQRIETVGTALQQAPPAVQRLQQGRDLGGQGVTIAVLQNVGVEESTLAVVPGATVEQYPSIADAIAAMDAGRADAAGVDLSSGKWFASTTPGKYKFTDGYNSMSYSAAVKPGDQIWLNLVNTSWHEAMVGLNSKRYRASFKQWFGEDVPLPAVGFPVEFM